MNQARLIHAGDFAGDCPVPSGFVARLVAADSDTFTDLLNDMQDATRADLAVWLYGRSHTHAVGIRVAATCEENVLRESAGLVGTILHDLSRRPYVAPSHGIRAETGRRISLGGSSIRASA